MSRNDHVRASSWAALMFVLGIFMIDSTMAQSQPEPWGVMTVTDLKGIHDTLQNNHPGPVDPENPRFAKWLEDGFVQASQRAKTADSYSDYTRALRFYVNGFQDGHVAVSFGIAPVQIRWPAFIIGPDDNGAAQVIYAESDSGVHEGDLLLSCDGRSVDQMMKERVDPYYWNTAIPHQRALHFNHLFYGDPDDKEYKITACRFSSGNVELQWWWTVRSAYERKLAAALGKRGVDPELKRVNAVWFIRLPTFNISGEDSVKKMRSFVTNLESNAPELRNSTVVFDVRGNQGGNSAWGEEIASAIWGRAWVNYVEHGFDGTVDWRSSAVNIRWMEYILDRETSSGLTDSAANDKKVVEAMKAAMKAGEPFARIENRPKPENKPSTDPTTGRMFFLTDGECASACLDFADLMRRLPGVIHIGLPTSADTVYIDNRNANLPSGLGVFSYSMKVYRNRVRKNNEWYEPKYKWPGGVMTDQALTKWISSLAN